MYSVMSFVYVTTDLGFQMMVRGHSRKDLLSRSPRPVT